jgi:hypothetical protein
MFRYSAAAGVFFVLGGMLFISACGKKSPLVARTTPMAPPAFWVWHRTSSLKPAETESLRQAGVRSLYWQAAECTWGGGTWRMVRISAPMPGTADLEIIPVFRIVPKSAFLGTPGAGKRFAEEVRKWSGGSKTPREIQIDFDCPDRLLGDYARFLQSFGKGVSPARVSITALASWPRHPDFVKLANTVSLLAPMFYDLEADDPAAVKAGRFHPMADPAVARLIRLWADCPRPWLAGLPNFERLSVFETSGKLTGHLRGWAPDPVFFLPDLKQKPLGEGVTSFEITAPVELSGTRIPPGGLLVHRTADATVLSNLAAEADRAGARGILYFALPGPGIVAAFSAAHLAHVAETPRPVLEIGNKGRLVLKNSGPTDIPTRRWELELTSDQTGAFQSASPGAFAEADVPGGLPAELAGTIVLRFAGLHVGESIVSGPLIKDAAGLTWRIRDLTEIQPLKTADSAR